MDPDCPADRTEFDSFRSQAGSHLPQDGLVDDEPPEPVDDEKITAFYRSELPEPEREWIAFLISRYRAWHEADLRLIEKRRDTNE